MLGIKTKNMIKIENIESRIKMLEQHREQCERQHNEHAEHRRRLYDKIDEAIAYLKKISVTMEFIEMNKETIIRTHNSYITTDTLQSWAKWVAVIVGGVVAVGALIRMFF